MNEDSKKVFGKAMFDVEHALDIYASSFVTLPAEAIYDKEQIKQYKEVLKRCHIYIIGFLPIVDFVGVEEIDNNLKLKFLVSGAEKEIIIPTIPENFTLKEEDGFHYLENDGGDRFWWNELEMLQMLNQFGDTIEFDVKYIGQAYGKDGSRSAYDRLLKHETLQKIAVKGVPDGNKLSLLFLEIEPNNQMISVFNPFAQTKDEDSTRIKSGLDKLFNTNESERVSLYEASLIRYFLPEYNKEFKNSFPSTNLKVLKDCYEKDFTAIFAQICIDELPFQLRSDIVEPKRYHISKHDLHKEEDRKAFFVS